MLSRFILTWAVTLISIFPLATASAGNGKFNSATQAFDFCVSIRFDSSQDQKKVLKILFEGASKLLFETTNGQHEFGTITAYNNNLAGKSADVWVLPGRGSSFASPGGFGIPGRAIVLYYQSLVDTKSTAFDGAWIIAHAFMHHAYGMLDEYHDGEGGAAECLAGPSATHVCFMEDYKTAKKSGIESNKWCLHDNHDADLDSAQDAFHHRSCWETAKARYPQLQTPSTANYASPVFGVMPIDFQWKNGASTRRFVEIIDHSGSMGSHTSASSSLSLAKDAAKLFVDLTDPVDRLGVVAFDDTAYVVAPIATMTNAAKDFATQEIDKIVSGGGTSIGAGLAKALEIMDADGNDGCIEAMVLLSDGYHNTGIDPAVVVPQIVARSIPVFTIGLGDGVDTELMQWIASSTGGRYFAAPDGNQLNGIFAQISAELSDGGVIAAGSGFAASGEIKQNTMVVDAKTRVATFLISWDSVASKLVLILKGPDGISVTVSVDPPSILNPNPTIIGNPPTDAIEMTAGKSAVTLTVLEHIKKAGSWTLTFANKNTSSSAPPVVNYQYLVLSDDSDILVSAAPDKLNYGASDGMTICANVLYEAPITNIDVRAAITRPDGSIFEAKLKDDASLTSGDSFAEDGNFAVRFNGWNKNGIYRVSVDVTGTSSAKTVQGEAIDDKTKPISVKNFHRHTEFAVSVTGVSTIATTNMFIDEAQWKYVPINPLQHSASVIGTLDLDLGLVEPKKDLLTISVGSVGHGVEPTKLIEIDSHHYVFDIDLTASSSNPDKFAGFVDLFMKGTSGGAFELTSSGPPIGKPIAGDSIPIRFRWGKFDETLNVFPKVKDKQDGTTTAKYDSKKHDCSTDVFYVTSALVKLKGAPNQDKLSLRARFTSDYDPSAGITTIRFGNFVASTSDWTTSPNDPGKFDFASFNGLTGASISIHVDTELRELTIEGSGLDLKGFPNPAIVELQCAGFYQKTEITLAVGKKSLIY